MTAHPDKARPRFDQDGHNLFSDKDFRDSHTQPGECADPEFCCCCAAPVRGHVAGRPLCRWHLEVERQAQRVVDRMGAAPADPRVRSARGVDRRGRALLSRQNATSALLAREED